MATFTKSELDLKIKLTELSDLRVGDKCSDDENVAIIDEGFILKARDRITIYQNLGNTTMSSVLKLTGKSVEALIKLWEY